MIQKIKSNIQDWDLQKSILNIIFCLFTLSIITNIVHQLLYNYQYESWYISEWLINFQGGYVRRGLIGEILYFFAQHFNFDIAWVIKIFCLICMILFAYFFIKQFLRKGFVLYILPLSFFMGTHFLNGMFWHKRDYVILLLFMAGLWVYSKIKNIFFQLLSLNILMVLAIQVHEAIAFFTLPFLFILLLNRYLNKGIIIAGIIAVLSLSPSLVCFALTLHYHGDMTTAQTIWDSWVNLKGLTPAEVDKWSHGALSAIGWEKEKTFEDHYNINIWSESLEVVSGVYWIIIIPTVYYIITNVFIVFKKKDKVFTKNDKTILSAILIFQFFCLIPFFFILSCDLGRIFFYWVSSSFTVFLLIPKRNLESLFPKVYYKIITVINTCFEKVLKPSKATMCLLMFFIGIPTVGFEFEKVINSSLIKYTLFIPSEIILKLR